MARLARRHGIEQTPWRAETIETTDSTDETDRTEKTAEKISSQFRSHTLMHEITLRAMRFHVLVGVVPHERIVPQPIEVDLSVHVAPGSAVIDYRALYGIVARTFDHGPIDYLEEIGDRIAARTLEHDGRIRTVRVAVRKPHVALGGPLDYAEVVTERSADD